MTTPDSRLAIAFCLNTIASCLQAADIVQLVGIGRNEYIAIMNKCKAKKLLWRVNKSIAKEYLPVTPLDLNMQPWWTVGVVNLSKLAVTAGLCIPWKHHMCCHTLYSLRHCVWY